MPIEPLRVALVGAGSVSLRHLRTYQHYSKHLQLLAICDVNEELAKERASIIGVEKVYKDPYRMFDGNYSGAQATGKG
jgi:predicted dehydrogenase